MELLIPLGMAALSYGATWLVDRRQRPALIAGGGGGVLGALITLLILL